MFPSNSCTSYGSLPRLIYWGPMLFSTLSIRVLVASFLLDKLVTLNNHARSQTHCTQLQNQQKLITITNVCWLNCNIDLTHQSTQPHSLALFLTETQTSPSSSTAHFQFFNHIFFCFESRRPCFRLAIGFHLPSTNRKVKLIWLRLRLISSVIIHIFVALPIVMIPPFLTWSL